MAFGDPVVYGLCMSGDLIVETRRTNVFSTIRESTIRERMIRLLFERFGKRQENGLYFISCNKLKHLPPVYAYFIEL